MGQPVFRPTPRFSPSAKPKFTRHPLGGLKGSVNPQLNPSFSKPPFSKPWFLKHSISIYAYTYMDESLPGRSRVIWFACPRMVLSGACPASCTFPSAKPKLARHPLGGLKDSVNPV